MMQQARRSRDPRGESRDPNPRDQNGVARGGVVGGEAALDGADPKPLDPKPRFGRRATTPSTDGTGGSGAGSGFREALTTCATPNACNHAAGFGQAEAQAAYNQAGGGNQPAISLQSGRWWQAHKPAPTRAPATGSCPGSCCGRGQGVAYLHEGAVHPGSWDQRPRPRRAWA